MEHKTDYEVARDEAWARFYTEMMADRQRGKYRDTMDVFDYAFKEAYRYGRMVGMEEAKKQIDHIPETGEKVGDFGEEVNFPARARIAAMAMQGLLAGEDSRDAYLVAFKAVNFADALIAELGKNQK